MKPQGEIPLLVVVVVVVLRLPASDLIKIDYNIDTKICHFTSVDLTRTPGHVSRIGMSTIRW